MNPILRTDPWTFEEDQLLVKKYAEFGPQWNKISKFFDKRSDNNVRNRWQLMLRQWERKKNDKHPPSSHQANVNYNDNNFENLMKSHILNSSPNSDINAIPNHQTIESS